LQSKIWSGESYSGHRLRTMRGFRQLLSYFTITEFRELITDTIRETLSELLSQADPDVRLELNPEIVELIQRQRAEYETGILSIASRFVFAVARSVVAAL